MTVMAKKVLCIILFELLLFSFIYFICIRVGYSTTCPRRSNQEGNTGRVAGQGDRGESPVAAYERAVNPDSRTGEKVAQAARYRQTHLKMRKEGQVSIRDSPLAVAGLTLGTD